MNIKLPLKLLLLATVLASTAACTTLRVDPRDAPWDPKGHSSLMDQIPAWDGAADKLCCQHLKDYSQCKPPRTPRC